MALGIYRTDGSRCVRRVRPGPPGRHVADVRPVGELVKETDFGGGHASRATDVARSPADATPDRRLADMSDFSSRLDVPGRAVPAQPDVRDRDRRARPRRPLAGPDRRRAGRTAAFTDRWLAEFGAMTDLSPDEAIDRDLLVGELEAGGSPRPSCARTPGTRSLGLPRRGRAVHAECPRVRATGGPARVDGGSPRAPAGRARRRACDGSSGHAGRPVGRFQTETALKQLPGIGELIDEALAAAEAAAPTDPAVAAIQPRLAAAAETARAAVAGVRDPPARRGPSGERGRGPARARRCSRPRCVTRCAPRRSRRSGSWPARSASTSPSVREMVRLARRALADVVRRAADPGRRGQPRPRRPRRHRARASEGRRPARFLPRRERPDRGVLRRDRPDRAGRRTARDPVDADLPARVRRRDAQLARARSTRARRRSSRSRRCPTTGARSSASRTCARTTTGCSAC